MAENKSMTAFTLAEGATHVGVSYNNRRIAFTLAEVLITLGIIGVVAVLTLPNLMSDYRKKTYVAQLQRVYNQIQTAAQNCMADEDVDNLNDTYLRFNENYAADIKRDDYDSGKAYSEALDEAFSDAYIASAGRFLKKYFRVTKDCGYIAGDENDCLADSYKDINGGRGDIPWGYCINVNTGATICMLPFDTQPAKIYIDTNGKSGPNTYGRDVFYISMNYKGDLTERFGEDMYYEYECNGSESSYAKGCFDKIISAGWKMEY